MHAADHMTSADYHSSSISSRQYALYNTLEMASRGYDSLEDKYLKGMINLGTSPVCTHAR